MEKMTNKLVVNPYLSETFTNLASPRIMNVLFSPLKGLFFWAPILVFSIVGFFFLSKKMRFFLVPTIVFLCLHLYLVSSWWAWHFGGSYGHRAFVEAMPIFAFGMAAFVDELKNVPQKFAAYFTGIVFITVNLFLMFQYWRGIIPFGGVNLKIYFNAFQVW